MIWLDELAQHLKGNDPSIYDWDDGPFHVRASAQSSYGFLYVSVWVGPE